RLRNVKARRDAELVPNDPERLHPPIHAAGPLPTSAEKAPRPEIAGSPEAPRAPAPRAKTAAEILLERRRSRSER
ncbi:MAG TPA: hypothetical protein VFQ35_07475, partial [Polyangiaceae bacterium]|nr:hypothetical protein [Polyangiaceae bacterium]